MIFVTQEKTPQESLLDSKSVTQHHELSRAKTITTTATHELEDPNLDSVIEADHAAESAISHQVDMPLKTAQQLAELMKINPMTDLKHKDVLDNTLYEETTEAELSIQTFMLEEVVDEEAVAETILVTVSQSANSRTSRMTLPSDQGLQMADLIEVIDLIVVAKEVCKLHHPLYWH